MGGTFAAEDPLSRGRYDGDVIERLAGEARTGLGKIEIGITDGAGYDLAVSGPKVDPACRWMIRAPASTAIQAAIAR